MILLLLFIFISFGTIAQLLEALTLLSLLTSMLIGVAATMVFLSFIIWLAPINRIYATPLCLVGMVFFILGIGLRII